MRGRGLWRVVALAVPLGIIVLGIFAWRDAGRQPVRNIVVAVPVPELPR